MSLRKKIAWHSQGYGSHACHVLWQNGLVLDHPIPIRITVNGHYYCTPLQDMLRPALCHRQPELLAHGFIFSRTMQHLFAMVMCYSWCHAGPEGYWHILSTLQISPQVITGCLYVSKNIFGVNDLNRKMMCTLLSPSPCIV